MNAFEIGSRVRLSSHGRSRWADETCNPHDDTGTIRYMGSGHGLCISVNWDNGTTNSYEYKELEVPGSDFEAFYKSMLDRVMEGLSQKGIVKTAFNQDILAVLVGMGVIKEVHGTFLPVERNNLFFLTLRHLGETIILRNSEGLRDFTYFGK